MFKKAFTDTDPSSLREDVWHDAEDPFGKTIPALELVQGWHTTRLIVTMVVFIVLDTLIVAITTLVTSSLQSGMAAAAAGGYAIGLEALLISSLTVIGFIVS